MPAKETKGWLSTSGSVKRHMISTSCSSQTLDCLTSTLRRRYSIITGASRVLVMSVTPAPLHQKSPLGRTNNDHCENYWCQLGDRLTINPSIWPGFVELDTTQNHLFRRLHHFPGSVITGDLEFSAQFVLVSSLHPQPIQDATHIQGWAGKIWGPVPNFKYGPYFL